MISTKAKFQRLVALGFLLLCISVAIVYFFARDQFRDAIQNAGEAGNAALTRVFVNETWGDISRLMPPPGADAEAARKNPNLPQIEEKIRRFAMSTDIVKVKLYNMKGLTVYSSEKSQIGDDKSENNGFRAAARGLLASELTYRGKFSSFDAEIYARDLVSTYAPIREGYQVVAVAEIYSDRTASMKVTESLLQRFLFVMAGVFLLLYVFAVFVLWRVGRSVQARQTEDAKEIPNALSIDSVGNRAHANPDIPCPAGLRFYTAGFGALIHNLVLAGSLTSQKPSRLSAPLALGVLGELSALMQDRATRCRSLMQLKAGRYHPQVTELLLQEIEQHVNGYAENFSQHARPTISFYESGSAGGRFSQDQELLLHYLKTVVECAANLYPAAKLQIKYFWGEGSLLVETILSGTRAADRVDSAELADVFQMQLEALAAALGEPSKVVFTATGGVTSLEIRPKLSVHPSSERLPKRALLLGGTEHQVGLLSVALQGLGIEVQHLPEVVDVENFSATSSAGVVAFVCPDLANPAQVDVILGLVSRKGLAPSAQTFLVRDIFDLSPLPAGDYQVLDQPFDLASLRAAIAAKG